MHFVFPSTQCYLCLDLASQNKSVVKTSDQVSPKGIYKGECFFYHMLLRFIFSGGKKHTSSNVVDDQDTQTSPNACKRAKDTIYDSHKAIRSLHPPIDTLPQGEDSQVEEIDELHSSQNMPPPKPS